MQAEAIDINTKWQNDSELFALLKQHLLSALLGDVMDQLGLLHQFLPPQIQPLRDDMIVAGRAMPVLEADTTAYAPTDEPHVQKPFGLMLEALDDLKPNEVYICTGASPSYALWGELMALRATKLQAAGAVLDGYSRDTSSILQLNFPTFSYGRFAQDQAMRGRVIDFRCSIEMHGVVINPGDIIFGDLDGVCVVPKNAEKEIIRLALEKAAGEKLVRQAIENGMGAAAAFRKFGIM